MMVTCVNLSYGSYYSLNTVLYSVNNTIKHKNSSVIINLDENVKAFDFHDRKFYIATNTRLLECSSTKCKFKKEINNVSFLKVYNNHIYISLKNEVLECDSLTFKCITILKKPAETIDIYQAKDNLYFVIILNNNSVYYCIPGTSLCDIIITSSEIYDVVIDRNFLFLLDHKTLKCLDLNDTAIIINSYPTKKNFTSVAILGSYYYLSNANEIHLYGPNSLTTLYTKENSTIKNLINV